MPAAALADPALFTDRLHRQLCVAGDAAVLQTMQSPSPTRRVLEQARR